VEEEEETRESEEREEGNLKEKINKI